MKVIELSGTTDGSGALTVQSSKIITGYLEKIEHDYIDADTGADFTITCVENISVPLLTVTNAGTADSIFYPRAAPVNTSNAAITNAYTKIFCAGYPKLVVAQGTASKSIKLYLYFSDEV